MRITENQNLTQGKIVRLKQILSGMDGLLVAFSGGVDSTFLLDASHEMLGQRVIAVTAFSAARSRDDAVRAEAFCRKRGIKHIIFPAQELQIKEVAKNDRRRCYYCKRYLFRIFRRIAVQKGMAFVAEGSHCDDDAQYRPGRQALDELGIRSPLKEAGLTKSDIRMILKANGISIWDLPSQSCYLTRFPYGQEVTEDILNCTALAEEFLKGLGFRQVRVRTYGNDVSIEVEQDQILWLRGSDTLKAVRRRFKALGFRKIIIDKSGYRTGTMDEKRVGHG